MLYKESFSWFISKVLRTPNTFYSGSIESWKTPSIFFVLFPNWLAEISTEQLIAFEISLDILIVTYLSSEVTFLFCNSYKITKSSFHIYLYFLFDYDNNSIGTAFIKYLISFHFIFTTLMALTVYLIV